MVEDLIKRLKEAAQAATPQNLDTAQTVERYEDGSHITCPTCDGEGYAELNSDFCNYDGKAIGVQFYGIGPEHLAAEAYFRAASPAAILELIALIERLTARLTALESERDALLAAAGKEAVAEPLKQIAEHLTIMMMSAKCFVDHDDDDAVIGYRIKTGAIHRVIGLLAGMGCPVSIPSNMPLAEDPDVQTNIAEWQAKYPPNDFVMGDNTRNIASVVTPDSIAKAMQLNDIAPQPAPAQACAVASIQDSGEADVWPVPVSIETNYDVGQTVELIFEDDEDAERFTRLYSKHMATRDPEAAAEQADQAQPVAWMIRIGDSNVWSYTQLESDADFYGKQSGMKYEKRPLYTAPAAALENGDGRDAWQPIETAPKDGTPLILFARAKHATASAPVIGWWLPDMGWIESAYTPNHPVGIVPSHWMPRPEFPAALSQKAGEQQ
jgi:hypothetical protein